ncbi:MAG: competence/damage-inducible protein A [Cyanobacteria bacterium J06641_5]
MSAEVICVGTELLLGDIVNTNTQFLGQQLARLGIPHYFQSVVGDNPERIARVLAIASQRSQIVIFTGGLGPTPDDLTTETIAKFFAVPLVEHPEVWADIQAKFSQRQRPVPPSNHKQALQPKGARVLPNPTGTAPGMIWQPRPDLSILTFPGVPSEMQRMWQETAVPYLKSLGWGKQIVHSRTLRFWGIGESALAQKVASYFELSNPTVAPYASKGQVKLRVSALANSETAARALIDPIARELQAIAGDDYFGADGDTLASAVGNALLDRGQTLAVAESCTGGGLGAMITAVPGSSAYFAGGVIAYANTVKVNLLDVNSETLALHGAVSEPVAEQMALGIQAALDADWGLAITGIAGPGGGSPQRPVGLVYIGLAGPNRQAVAYEYRLGQDRDRAGIQLRSACHALDRLRRACQKSSSGDAPEPD